MAGAGQLSPSAKGFWGHALWLMAEQAGFAGSPTDGFRL